MLSSLIFAHVDGPAAPSILAVAIAGRWLLLVGLCLLVGASFVATVIYPAPRRLYGAQVYPREQYYYDRGYAPQYAPPAYYQPRQYYQPRGLFTYQD